MNGETLGTERLEDMPNFEVPTFFDLLNDMLAFNTGRRGTAAALIEHSWPVIRAYGRAGFGRLVYSSALHVLMRSEALQETHHDLAQQDSLANKVLDNFPMKYPDIRLISEEKLY